MNQQINIQDKLTTLDVFVGNWSNTGVVHAGRFGDGGECTGDTVYHWDNKRVWLHYTSTLQMPGMGEYEVSGAVSYDDKADHYIAFAHNNMRSLLTYRGYWEDDQMLIFLSTFPQADTARIIYTVADSIVMKSQSLGGDGDYLTYFETTMTLRK